MISARRTVVVDGRVGRKEFLARDLTCVHFDKLAQLQDASVRAIIFTVPGIDDQQRTAFAQKLRRLGKTAAEGGALVVVLAARAHLGTVQRVADHVGGYTFAQMTSGGARLTQPQVLVLPSDEVARAAEAVARHDPGPAENPALKITDQSPGVGSRDEETNRLLRRAFSEFEEITIHRLTGGLSGDGVWRVQPRHADREVRTPFIVKCGLMSDMDEHIETYRDFVADRIPFRGCAPLCFERCVRGSMRRLAVTRFIEHADPLDEAARDHDVVQAIASIYEKTMVRWRTVLDQANLQLFEEYLPKVMWDERYREALDLNYRRLRRRGARLLTPTQLASRLYKRPAVHCPLVRAHNDLNIRNVFVCGRHSEAVLIDFTSAKKRPLAFDIARLDVGLGFDDGLHQHQPIASDVLVALYADDPFRWSLAKMWTATAARHRLDGIFHLRARLLEEAHGAAYDVTEEYTVALCSSLLWYARNDTALARTAYECAARLAERL